MFKGPTCVKVGRLKWQILVDMATKQNFTIEQRATFERTLVWRTKTKRPMNLTGYSAKLQVRASASALKSMAAVSTVVQVV